MVTDEQQENASRVAGSDGLDTLQRVGRIVLRHSETLGEISLCSMAFKSRPRIFHKWAYTRIALNLIYVDA